MFISFDADRPSSSPFIERVWRCHSTSGGPFLAVGSTHWELVVSRVAGHTSVTIHGPETRHREVHCPADGEWCAIRFKAGTFMPGLPVHQLIDGQDVNLAPAFRGRFRLDDSAWEIPGYDNAEIFVNRLVRRGLLTRDASVAAALAGDNDAMKTRTAQRHFLHSTGMSHAALRQIERARLAIQLLREGRPPVDVVHDAGYFDQAHLTRALRKFVGLTPGAVARETRQLSFLYKT